jgi:radical SAM superfamily enzyme YgiQ (UPF0313 family)
LREAGFQVEIADYEYLYRMGLCDLQPERWLEQLCEPLLAANHLIVGITALADTLPTCILIGRYLKRQMPSVTVVIGGPGVFGTLPELLQIHNDAVDYVCDGEGELCFQELATRLAAGERRPVVRGFHSAVDGQVMSMGRHPFADLNHLPMPAYDLLPVPSYLELASPRIFDVYVGSGCTYLCRFCVTSLFWSREFRSKSPETLMRELDFLHQRFGSARFNFLHDNFANQRHYLDEFIEYFRQFNTKYEWGCAVRPDNVTLDQLQRMRQAGCFNVFCGTDSGSSRILKAMQKMPSARRSYEFFANCRASGLQYETNTIIGYPDELDVDLEESLELIFASAAGGSENSDASVLQPLPGAPVTLDHAEYLEYVEDNGMGTFLPPETIAMVKASPRMFSGFYFIRKNNRTFQTYTRFVDLIRFFTRHWLRTVYFLKRKCGIRLIDLLDRIAEETATAKLGEQLGRVIEGLGLPASMLLTARSIYLYEAAEEEIASVDIANQVQNIYAAPRNLNNFAAYKMIDLALPVHRIFSAFPEIQEGGEEPAAATYLFFRRGDGRTSTLFLKPWQRDLWIELRAGGDKARVVASTTSRLALGRSTDSYPNVFHSVHEAVDLFSEILSDSNVRGH